MGRLLFIVTENNRIYIKAPVDEAVDEPDGILITETPEFIYVCKVEQLNLNHVLYGLVGTLYCFVY